MNVKLTVLVNDKAVREQRREWAMKVIDYFADALPDLPLAVLLDYMEWDTLKAYGEENRGAFVLVNKDNFYAMDWPFHLRGELATVDEMTLKIAYTCKAAVYLHDSTCRNADSLTTTLAHELQHFIQYGKQRTVWAFNNVALQLHKATIARLGLTWHDIPIEREARIVAKRASEALLGTEATAAYIGNRVAKGTIPHDIADWKAIREIDPDAERGYDCASETRRLF